MTHRYCRGGNSSARFRPQGRLTTRFLARPARSGPPRPQTGLAQFALALLALALVLLVTACGGTTPAPASAILPTHRDLDAYPDALLEATLTRDDRCLFATRPDSGERWLPIWPSGYSMVGDTVMNGTTPVATVGDRVKLGGGEYHETEYDFLRTLMPADVPGDCRVDLYWLVSTVVP